VFNNGIGFDGTDAVHTHMTNSRLTDPKCWKCASRALEDFHIRRARDERPTGSPLPLRESRESGSGGGGKYSAGNGTLRTIRFLERMDCAILSSHRTIRPQGSSAASRANLAPPGSAALTAGSKNCKAPIRPCLNPAKPSSSAPPPGAAMAPPDLNRAHPSRRRRQARVKQDVIRPALA
jgi:hypothetical protein